MCKYLLGMLISIIAFSGCSQEGGSPQAGLAPPPTEVGFMTVTTRNVQIWQELSGRVKASLQADVRPQVDGIIQERLFTEGSQVREGQVLYRLDPDSYQAAFSQASAAVKNAEANLRAVQLKSERYTQLGKAKGVAQQDVDDAVAAYQQGQAEADEKRALLETARIDLERTEIKAPISGLIGISSMTVGQLVTARQTEALATIRSLDPVYVDITQPSVQKIYLRRLLADNKLRNGNTEVRLRLEDDSVYEHSGKMQLQEIAVDESTGSVTLRAVFPNPESLLLPGMFVRTMLSEAVHENAILVKQQAVTRNAREEGTVMVVTPDNLAEQRRVVTGPTVGEAWVIFEGLNAGDRVIVEGLNKIKPGDTVIPVEVQTEVNDYPENVSATVSHGK